MQLQPGSSGAPNANHIQHTKQNAIQTRENTLFFDDLMGCNQPLYQTVLGARRGLSFALTKRPDNSDDHVTWYATSRVQILDQGSDGCLIQRRLHRYKLHNISKSILVKATFCGITADDIDYAGDFDGALLCWCPGSCKPL